MLIPPSVLMIVWGVLTEQAIGKIFIAGILPGFALVALYCIYILVVAIREPARVGAVSATASARGPEEEATDVDFRTLVISTLLVFGLIAATLGGIWLGFFTPTEGAGVGAAFALLIALWKGMRRAELVEVVLSVGRTSAPILLLLFCAQLYSRVLSMTGITGAVRDLFLTAGMGVLGTLAVMVAIWFVLGCVIDSISIILLTVPVFAPVAMALGVDPLAFAVLGIIAIETGLLTPPFGILVFTVRAALPHEASVSEIFRGAIPYWFALIGTVILIGLFPRLATWLPNLGTPGAN
jgi:tripartite ATP-independent transporter DctM subunit